VIGHLLHQVSPLSWGKSDLPIQARGLLALTLLGDVPHRHHVSANVYQVRIDIKVPGEEIAVTHEPAEHEPYYANVDVAIRDAFDSAARQLKDYVRRHRKDVKHHGAPTHGRVVKLFFNPDYGFIDTPHRRELYFHANSVLDGKFDALSVGSEVAFVEELGDKGPQASTMRIVSRHHH
jgi:cold shock CspA family protein